MGRIMKVATLLILLMVMLMTSVNAVTSSTLADTLYSMGAKYGVTSADKLKMERYLADNPVTDAQAETIVAKANEAIAIMDAAGVTNVAKLSKADKEKIMSIAKDAASTIGLTLVFKTKTVEVYKDGKLIEAATLSNGKLAYTGNSLNTVLVVSSTAVIALAMAFVAKKRLANAK